MKNKKAKTYTLSNEEIDAYNSLLASFMEPKTISDVLKERGLPGTGMFNAKMQKLAREGFVEIVGEKINKVSGYKMTIYKTVISEYATKEAPKPIDFGTEWLNKMFGINKIEPVNAKLIQEKNIPQPLKKAPKAFVSGSTLHMAI